MAHGESGGDAVSRIPDGPPPAREQLPLPRRKRQAHLEPQLRTPGGTGAGTPFAAFAAPPLAPAEAAPAQPAPTQPTPAQPAPPEATPPPSAATPQQGPADRAAAFHAGARRARGATHTRRTTAARRPEQGSGPRHAAD